MFLLCIIIVNATPSCFADELCTLYGSCKNETYTQSTATITIYNPDTSVFIDQADMTEIDVGRFNYTFTAPETIGNYLQTINCTIGEFNAVDEDEFIIGENKMIADQISVFIRLGIVGLFYLVHFALLIIGFSFSVRELVFLSGILGILSSIIGLALISHLIGTVGIIFFVAYLVISTIFTIMAGQSNG